jgi:hypothetical protein
MLRAKTRTAATGPKALTRTRHKQKRIRVILAAVLTAALALGLAGPSTWQSSRHLLRHIPEAGQTIPPTGVITQARARQHRRRRKIAAAAAVAAAEAVGRATDSSPPRLPRRRSRPHDHAPAPVLPPPQAERLTGLPTAGDPVPSGLSCPSAGSCAIDGTYDGRTGGEMFVANETRGQWGKAETVSGIPAANFGVTAAPVSCPSAGSCVAAGFYESRNQRMFKGFTVAEHKGAWGSVQGIPSPKSGTNVEIDTLSCASAGNCAVGGSYSTAVHPKVTVPLATSETNGRWHRPQPIPGLSALPGMYPSDSQISGISCAPAGNCTAEGTYTKKFPDNHVGLGVFVVSENQGTWGRAESLSGFAARSRDPGVTQISCASPGNCSLIGFNALGGKRWGQAFVASQTDSTWGNSEPIHGIKGDYALTGGLSCLAPGECTADGDYITADGLTRPFTVTQTDGTWHDAQEVPGTAIQSAAVGTISFDAISCASTGNCLAGGSFDPSATINPPEPGIASETDGTWHDAHEVPGITALKAIAVDSEVAFISCPPGAPCVSAGTYATSGNINWLQSVFVVG